jgi:hypothetical protein
MKGYQKSHDFVSIKVLTHHLYAEKIKQGAKNLEYIANQVTYYTDELAVNALVQAGIPSKIAISIIFILL